MKLWLALLVVASSLFLSQGLAGAQNSSELAVLDYSWSRYHQAINTDMAWEEPPAYRQPSDRERSMAERQYGDLMRSQALQKAERNAIQSAIRRGEAYTYKLKVHNTSDKVIRNVFWEYQIIEAASPENLARRQFFCAVKMKANERKSFAVLSIAPPKTGVITAKTLQSNSRKAFAENAVINRIEFADGSSWQRQTWIPPNAFTLEQISILSNDRRLECAGF